MDITAKIRTKLLRQAGRVRNNLRHTLGLNEAIYNGARGARILTYHGICTNHHLRYNTIFLNSKTFEAHLKFFKKYCNVVSLDDFYQQRFSNHKFNICLTFDDGFANNHQYVLPLLEQYQIPATFFVTAIGDAGHNVLWNDFLSIFSKHGPQTLVHRSEAYKKNRHNKYIRQSDGILLADKLRSVNFADKAELMQNVYHLFPFKETVNPDYWLQMTPDQIQQLSQSPYVTIGAHGYYHNDLAQISIADATDEMQCSKQYLENITGKPITSLAFPYGTYTPEVISAAKQIGYNQLLALEFLNKADHADATMRERFTVNPFISVPNQMRAILEGSYEL